MGCMVCGKKFISQSHKRNHMKTHASPGLADVALPAYPCIVCDKKFSMNKSRRAHEQEVHFPQNACYIEGCTWTCAVPRDKRWSTFRSTLAHHLVSSHGLVSDRLLPHRCKSCTSSFETASALKEHIVERHERPESAKCPHCPYVTNKTQKLYIHKVAYHSTKSYECNQCSFSCKWEASLYRHKQTIHLGKKNHKCPVCGMKFTQGCSVSRHMKKAHADI